MWSGGVNFEIKEWANLVLGKCIQESGTSFGGCYCKITTPIFLWRELSFCHTETF